MIQLPAALGDLFFRNFGSGIKFFEQLAGRPDPQRQRPVTALY